jgi:Mn-dependent DtxR family transcriptional regulator
MDNPEDPGRLRIQVDDGVVSPIILARYLNVKPQMIYQAIRDGKLTAVDYNNTQKKFVRLTTALEWAAKYLTRKQLRDLEKAQEEAESAAS